MKWNAKPSRIFWMTLITPFLSFEIGVTKEIPPSKSSSSSKRAESPSPLRNFKTFLPKVGEAIDAPSSQVVQVLLDRQEKDDYESYMVQVLFRGRPAEHGYRVFPDRVEIDFYDTGKPSMRLTRIRGGAIEASSIEEFFYREASSKIPANRGSKIKRLVRLTLFIHEKAELKFRDTLDRTLIHFRLSKDAYVDSVKLDPTNR